MDLDKRNELIKRREMMKRNALAKSRAESISDLLKLMDDNGVKYEVQVDDEVDVCSARNWLFSNFPFTDHMRIDWKQSDDKVIQVFSEIESFEEGFCFLLGKDYEFKEKRVSVIWTNQLRPIFSIALDDAVKYSNEITDEDWDTWFVMPEENWVIEYHHDGDLKIGYVKDFAESRKKWK